MTMAIGIHMPVGYTELYARKLNELSPLNILEAEEGLEVRSGSVFVAPAGRHLRFRRNELGQVVTHLDVRPLDAPHRPSIDVLFQSAAEVYAGRVLGVVMTGMGSDGRDGAAWIKAKGGTILTGREHLRRLRHAAIGRGSGLERSKRGPRSDGRSNSGARVKHKLLLVDDSGLARRSLRAILESTVSRSSKRKTASRRSRATFSSGRTP
jgi:hypothetical protein